MKDGVRTSKKVESISGLDVLSALVSPPVLERSVMTGVLLPADVTGTNMLETVLENNSVLLGEIFWLSAMLELGELLNGSAVLELGELLNGSAVLEVGDLLNGRAVLEVGELLNGRAVLEVGELLNGRAMLEPRAKLVL